jgi:hypothetical protein
LDPYSLENDLFAVFAEPNQLALNGWRRTDGAIEVACLMYGEVNAVTYADPGAKGEIQ